MFGGVAKAEALEFYFHYLDMQSKKILVSSTMTLSCANSQGKKILKKFDFSS